MVQSGNVRIAALAIGSGRLGELARLDAASIGALIVYAPDLMAAGDGLGGTYAWSAVPLVDNGTSVIVPSYNPTNGAWVLSTANASTQFTGPQSHASLAALKASKPPASGHDLRHVTGYASDNDGGGGPFVWKPGDTTPDDGCTCLASTYVGAPAGRWCRIYSGPLDARWFGVVADWNQATQSGTDNIATLRALIATIPASQTFPTQILLPRGGVYCSDSLRVNRNVEFLGAGKMSYHAQTAITSALVFPPLKGLIFDGYFSSQDYPGGRADSSYLHDVHVLSTQALASDDGGDWGQAMFQLDTTFSTWAHLAATASLGTCVIPSGLTVGSNVGEYYGDGHTRGTMGAVVPVMFRCTTAGTKGSAEPGAFAMAGIAQLGTTIAASSGTAVWTVESVPKDFLNGHAYVPLQNVVIPGDNDHVFQCVIGGTTITGALNAAANGLGVRCNANFQSPAFGAVFYDAGTTVDTPSDGVVLPFVNGTLHGVDTTDLTSSGTVYVWTGSAYTAITYTGKTGTTLTQCNGGTGTLHAGAEIGQGVQWKHLVGGELVAILAANVRIERVTVGGATGAACWVTSNYQHGPSGGADFTIIDRLSIMPSGSGVTFQGSDANGCRTNSWEAYFLGAGHTNVDNAAYLNLSIPKFGNAGVTLKDHGQANRHDSHYSQFANSPAYRNDLLGNPTGTNSTWLNCDSENGIQSLILSPAVAVEIVQGLHPDSTCVHLHGSHGQNIRGQCPLASNGAKSVTATLGQSNKGVAAALSIFNSDDSYSMGYSPSEDWTARPHGWWVFGQQDVPTGWLGTAFMHGRPVAGVANWNTGSAVGAESTSVPFWITNTAFWLGYSPNTDPISISRGTSAPASGYWVAGSIRYNDNVASGQPEGWRCTATGSPGTWSAMANHP
jgi:hypothetical protein